MMSRELINAVAPEQLMSIGWRRLEAQQVEPLAELKRLHGLDLLVTEPRAAVEERGFVIIPVNFIAYRNGQYHETRVVFALSKTVLISVEYDAPLGILDDAQQTVWAQVQAGEPLTPAKVLAVILQTLNDAARAVIRQIFERLDALSESVIIAGGGYQVAGRQVGVGDIADTVGVLAEAEELVAKTVEAQLMLARAVRWLRRVAEDDSLRAALTILLSDIHSLRRYAQFQHDKIRNMQQSLMTTLDLKQNNIIKVFTVITAVFTPPTLIAAFYGQNFAEMPELFLPWGEWAVIVFTGVSALLPLAYIKKKGWMR